MRMKQQLKQVKTTLYVSPNNCNEYDSAVTAAKAIINQTSNPNDGTKYYYASNIASDN
ncbi:hypothetical protein UM590_03540 [Staphylococcus aureus]|nr:hypothetical protein UM590_03540 [Staphylococcus aureus]